jgi:hypothetical protein
MTKSKINTEANETRNSDDAGDLNLRELTYEDLMKGMHSRSILKKRAIVYRMLHEWCGLGGAATSHVLIRFYQIAHHEEQALVIKFGNYEGHDYACGNYDLVIRLCITSTQLASNTTSLESKGSVVKYVLDSIHSIFKPLASKSGKRELLKDLEATQAKLDHLNWLSCVADDLAHCKAKHK